MEKSGIEWKPVFGSDGRYSGNYRIGLWYHTGTFANRESADLVSGNYGVYILIDQPVYRENSGPNDPQGLGVFFQFGWAPADRNAANRHFGAGFTYTGILSSRNRDILGLGISHTRLIGGSAGDENAHLTNLEIYYAAQLCPGFLLQPDIQYFSNAGASGNDGWAIGLRAVLEF